MASKTIKGLTVEIGGDTTKLGKALDNVNKQSKNLSGELRDINKLLKMDPGNADLLAQKQKVLANAVNDTSKKLEILKEAERQVQEQFERGEVSEAQVRELQREIIATTQKLEDYKREAKETADALERLGDEAADAGKDFDTLSGDADKAERDIDDFSDSADEAERESEDLGSSLDGTLAAGFSAVIGVATAAAAAIAGCVESSRDYRTAMGKLDTAFSDNQFSAETAKDTYKELQGILGDTDQAVEASGHLAQLARNNDDLAEWTEILTGVYAKFGDSLPIEGLAEAANETIKTGQVTGALADALNWAVDENETFGVKLKENIEWTELSSKELKELTDEQKAEYEARKEQYDAIEAYNKMVNQAISAEDKFNLALASCTDEQERQELITKTLTGVYKKSATQYKKTNKSVIEANKANEDWNETVAEIGDEMEPTMTEIKKFGTEILKSAKAPLKDVADFIVQKVLPAIGNLGKWAVDNLPLIKAGLVGITTALVAYKVATIAAEVAQKGLKGALLATEAAQKLVNIATAATPWGLAAVAIAGVVAAIAVYSAATQEAAEKTDWMTEKERDLMEAADKAAEEMRDQKDAAQEAATTIQGNMGHLTNLKDELFKLADASGKVKEEDQGRVQFILNELNNALGTEYEMTGGVIQQYEDLKESIDSVIKSKTTNLLLEAHNESYVAALDREHQLMENIILSEKDYQGQLAAVDQAYAKYVEENRKYHAKLEENENYANTRAGERDKASLSSYKAIWQQQKDILAEKKTEWDAAAAAYVENADVIMNYEEAQAASLQGNHDVAIELLKGKSESFHQHTTEVDEATAEALDILFQEAVNAGLAAKRTKENFKKGMDGYTSDMIVEAEEGYNAAMNAYANAYADAMGVGSDLGAGLEDGMEDKRGSLLIKARSMVSSILATMRAAADSNSPSKETMDFGMDLGEGTEIGMEKSTDDILGTAKKQVQKLLVTYRKEGEDAGPQVFRGINERALARNSQTMRSITDSNAAWFDKILAAIERGQVLTIDGKALVGATADKTDGALGQKRALVARGAV